MLSRWKLGAIAARFLSAVRELAQDIELKDVAKVFVQVVMIEFSPAYAGRGQGARKVAALMEWFGTEYPNNPYITSQVREFAGVIVLLMNAVEVFKS